MALPISFEGLGVRVWFGDTDTPIPPDPPTTTSTPQFTVAVAGATSSDRVVVRYRVGGRSGELPLVRSRVARLKDKGTTYFKGQITGLRHGAEVQYNILFERRTSKGVSRLPGDIDQQAYPYRFLFATKGSKPVTISPPAQTVGIDAALLPPAPKPGRHAVVSGVLVDADGAPIPDIEVAAFDKWVRSEVRLGTGRTSVEGRYSISYEYSELPQIIVRAYDQAGKVIAMSGPVCAKDPETSLDLTTSKDNIVRKPSRFTNLQTAVIRQLHGTTFTDLIENGKTHEIKFVAQCIDSPFVEVANLYIAHKLGKQYALRDDTLFGLFAHGVPAALMSALNNLPDAGIDNTFIRQVMQGVLADARETLSDALKQALAVNAIPGSYAEVLDRELSRLDDLRAQKTGSAPYIRGKTALNDLLAVGNLADAVKTSFIRSYADHRGRIDLVWQALRENKSLNNADLVRLNTTLSAGELLDGNLLLVSDALGRLAKRSLPTLDDLARLDQADWEVRIRQIDPRAQSIPIALPAETPDQRIARLAKKLAQRFESRFPTMAFAGRLAKSQNTPFKTKTRLLSFLDANRAFKLNETNIDNYISTNHLSLELDTLAELKVAQRLLRVSPRYEAIEALKNAGYESAQSVYFKGRTAFTSQMAEVLGGPLVASEAFACAEATYAAMLTAFGRYHLSLNGLQLPVFASAQPDPTQIAQFAGLQSLFGSLDYCECSDCRSVLSPAAYLVDLLQFLDGRGALATLISRRPDLQFTALSCNNTNITVPYIDLVNEILEDAVVPLPATDPDATVRQTAGTSAERRALPQRIRQDPYGQTQGICFPISLPFDLMFAETTEYLDGFGLSRAATMRLFWGAPAGPTKAAIGGTALAINPEMQKVITATDGRQPWERWGLLGPSQTNIVFDSKSGTMVSGTWLNILANVPILLRFSGLSLRELYQLLEVQWVTGGAVTLKPGVDREEGQSIVSCDTDKMTFTGLTGDALDRANRFIRLWRSTGLAMWELDSALAHANNTLDDSLVGLLSDLLSLRTQLGMPLQHVLALWSDWSSGVETTKVVNHLGDQDIAIPSTYDTVFRDPTLAAFSKVFVDVSQNEPFTAKLDDQATVDALSAALGISADDVAVIRQVESLPSLLSLKSLGVFFQYARLALSQSLSVPDFVLWTQLTQSTPFNGASNAIEFIRRRGVLQAIGLGVHDLDYLLRDQAPEKSALAFTTDQRDAVLLTARMALAKLTEDQRKDPTRQQTILTQILASATSTRASIVNPVLVKILPNSPMLDTATVSDLLAKQPDGTYQYDASHFPQLTNAFTAVAKAAGLSNALHPTASEFTFVVQHAGDFSWLDPSTLPLTPTTTSSYAALEQLIQALKLDQRQRARKPKLFDVLSQWLDVSPVDVVTAVSALAPSLNASIPDVMSLVTTFGVTAPSALQDISLLNSFAKVLDLVARYGISAAALQIISDNSQLTAGAAAARAAFNAQYNATQWFKVIQPVEDTLREQRRDALVAYLLRPNPADGSGFTTVDELFGHYLIDPEMSACAITTRLLQASLTVQQFVQRCYLNLEPPIKPDASWDEWSWMKQFRLWQANRQVFLYPENYLLPELRTDKSPFFTALENDVRQSDMNADSAEQALENFMTKLVEVSRLVVGGHYHETKLDGSRALHVFAHTNGTPPNWYYRQRIETPYGHGTWTAWELLNLGIHGDHVMPVIWDQRLHLVWPFFKQQTERQKDQQVPSAGGGSSTPPLKYWVVEFSISDRRAGHWQPKRTLAQKMFFFFVTQTRDPLTFTFKAFQDGQFNLQVEAYSNVYWDDAPPPTRFAYNLFGAGTLSSPDDPFRVLEDGSDTGLDDFVDGTQEPSYKFVGTLGAAKHLTRPNGYIFAGQDFVSVKQTAPSVPLIVLCADGTGFIGNVSLLGTIANPYINPPQQEAVFDSVDPFFVSDLSRAFFVQPHYYTISSSPQELDTIKYSPQWNTEFSFENFYHPFARTFQRELEIGGVDRLMQRELQVNPESVRGWAPYNFANVYTPQPPVKKPYPCEDVDFETEGAYSLYNWEIFYHAPMFIASLLMQNRKYEEALNWLQYIFDPTDSSAEAPPKKYWRTKPFHEMNANDWLKQMIEQLLKGLAVDKTLGITDPDAAAIQDWLDHPFDPHRIAKLRIAAYAKSTVMKFLDVLIAWGDTLYTQDTMESVTQAAQLYVFASMILGPRPEQVRLASQYQPGDANTATYASIKSSLDQFSNALVDIENVVPVPPWMLKSGPFIWQRPTLPRLLMPREKALFFCIPPNAKLLAYWDIVADRLYKIRHCMNIAGVVRQLPLYAPPIDPLLLIEAQAAGEDVGGFDTSYRPVYRFTAFLQRAVELANDVRSFGQLLLSALEKKDVEHLAALRSGQELDILQQMLDVKTQQAAEAQDQITALEKRKAVVQARFNYYSGLTFPSAWEAISLGAGAAALIADAVALGFDLTAGVAHIVPKVDVGIGGFGGTPVAKVAFGGENVGRSSMAFSDAARGLANILREGGQLASQLAVYMRRSEEWGFQVNAAQAELDQVEAEKTVANDRLNVANDELKIHNQQITNAQAVDDFLNSKYTNEQLYDWILNQLTSVYTQAYQLAVDLARRANAAYNYELGTTDNFIQFGYWDSQHKGLLAAESLVFDLRRMEASYFDTNARELELTKHVSLALSQPEQLVQLRQTGMCQVTLDESLFDRDYPGHYFRRLRAVSLTVPCLVGPYTGVNASLSLVSSRTRVQATAATAASYIENPPGSDLRFVYRTGDPVRDQIATSSGQNDPGLFDVNLRDERFLPFEGHGVISTFALILPQSDNQFDFSTITDVVLHVRYTARPGISPDVVRQALKPKNERQILISASSALSNAYYLFLNTTDPNATQQLLSLTLDPQFFPYSNLGRPKISNVTFYFLLSQAATGASMDTMFGPHGGTANSLTIADPGGNSGLALTGSAPLQGAAPGVFDLVVPEASVPPSLATSVNGHTRLDPAKIQDVLLIVQYTIT